MGIGNSRKIDSEVMREVITKTLENLNVEKTHWKIPLYEEIIKLYQEMFKEKHGRFTSQLSHRSSSPKNRVSQFLREKLCNEYGWRTVYRKRYIFDKNGNTKISYLKTPYLVRIKNE